MIRRTWNKLLLAAVLLFLPGRLSLAQPALPAGNARADYISPFPETREIVRAFGDRLHEPKKERTVFTGKLTDARGNRVVQFAWELPGRFRYDEMGPSPKSLGFDGSRPWAGVAQPSDTDEDLMESLAADTTQGFLVGTNTGSYLRVLGRRFRIGNSPAYNGPYYDILELVGPVPHRRNRSVQQKFFYFDSSTFLLASVHYILRRGMQETQIVTEISDWKVVDAQAFPGRIVRTEDGRAVATVVMTSTSVLPKVDDGIFAPR